MAVSERVIQQKILVAVDFGTTYSGIAWGQTGDASAQNIIQHWPDENSTKHDLFHGKSTDYVPTTLIYSKRGNRWGYQIRGNESRHEWFKLGLDQSMQRETSSLASRYPASTRLPWQLSSGSAITPAILATDYLKALYDHMEYMLLQTVTKAALKRTPREYIITVPAVWTEKARDLTLACAVKAGMGLRENLHIVSEPEAAALYAFKEMNSCGLNVNDTFVVCDAGGGTVDLISYTVLSLDPMLQLEEAAPGTGDACGSTFLNRIFAQFLNDKFRGDADWEADPDIFDEAMEHFETQTKITFNGDRAEFVPVRNLKPRAEIKKSRLMLSSRDLRGIFEPVVTEIIVLIRNQIQQTENHNQAMKKKVKLILLVGGFGSSFYLKSRIMETFGSRVEVKMAPNCQTAVVRGALMKGLAEVKGSSAKVPRVRVEARKARKHYGTECFTPYISRKRPGDRDGHSPERKQWIDYAGGWHVQNMRWFLKKEQGESVKESEPRVFEFSTDTLVSEGPPKQISINVYSHSDPMNIGAPEYKTLDVVKLGSVTANIRGMDPSLLIREQGYDGQQYYVLDFDIEMKIFAGKIEFAPVYRYELNGLEGQKRFPPAKVDYA